MSALRPRRPGDPVLQTYPVAPNVTTAVEVTLLGPSVTRSISWDDVRAYLRREGWIRRDIAAEPERWNALCESDRYADSCVFVGWAGFSIREAVETLARRASVSPGEMLARIADAAEPLARPYDERCRGETADGRCRLAWDHNKRGVPCRTTVAP